MMISDLNYWEDMAEVSNVVGGDSVIDLIIIGPDGTTTVDKITEPNLSSTYIWQQHSSTNSSWTSITSSFSSISS